MKLDLPTEERTTLEDLIITKVVEEREVGRTIFLSNTN